MSAAAPCSAVQTADAQSAVIKKKNDQIVPTSFQKCVREASLEVVRNIVKNMVWKGELPESKNLQKCGTVVDFSVSCFCRESSHSERFLGCLAVPIGNLELF